MYIMTRKNQFTCRVTCVNFVSRQAYPWRRVAESGDVVIYAERRSDTVSKTGTGVSVAVRHGVGHHCQSGSLVLRRHEDGRRGWRYPPDLWRLLLRY